MLPGILSLRNTDSLANYFRTAVQLKAKRRSSPGKTIKKTASQKEAAWSLSTQSTALEEGQAPLLTFPQQIPHSRDLSYAETDAHVAGFGNLRTYFRFSNNLKTASKKEAVL